MFRNRLVHIRSLPLQPSSFLNLYIQHHLNSIQVVYTVQYCSISTLTNQVFIEGRANAYYRD